MINLHITNNTLIVVSNNTTVLTASDSRYEQILKVLSTGFDEKLIENILNFVEVEQQQKPKKKEPELWAVIKPKKEVDEDRLKIDVKNDRMTIDNIDMPASIQKKFLELKKRHKSRSYLLRFWDNLQKNPNPNSIKMLYQFLDHNGHTIMADGNFIAYKAVRLDLKDHHTGKTEHKVGQVIKLERKLVDSDPKQTCSSGLHVCSFDYLKDFHPSESRWFEVLVKPQDVVCVPVDYDGTKCRVCAYKVYREIKSIDENQRTKIKKK